MNQRLHANELPIDTALVRTLVDAAFPEHSNLPIERLGASGSTNALFRLGDDLLVRLPRQPGGGALGRRRTRITPRRATTGR